MLGVLTQKHHKKQHGYSCGTTSHHTMNYHTTEWEPVSSLAEETDDFPGLGLPGHNLQKGDAVPGKDDIFYSLRKIG